MGFWEKWQVFMNIHMSYTDEILIPSKWVEGGYLNIFSLFGLSSFTYALAGVLMLTVFDGNYELEPKVGIPQKLHLSYLVLQSCVTFVADVLYCGTKSIWHFIDRVTATGGTIFLSLSIVYVSIEEVAMFAVIIPTGILCLFHARMARAAPTKEYEEGTDSDQIQKAGQAKGPRCCVAFARWHALWHVYYPLGAILWLTYRQYEEFRLFTVLGVVAMAIGVLYLHFFQPNVFHRHLHSE